MNVLNEYVWASFLISDIFETIKIGKKIQVPTGAMVEKKYLVEGSVPRITVTGINNGVYGYYEYKNKNNPNYRVYKNFVSVSFLGTVFYQKDEASLDMKVHCLKPKEIELNENTGNFLVAVIKQSINNSSYADQISSTVLPQMSIKMPVDDENKIAWDAINKFMQDKKKIVDESIESLLFLERNRRKKIDSKLWKKYPIGYLFDVVKGSRLTKADMKEGCIRYIGASSFDNGITQFISNSDHLHPGNTLTVCYNGSDIGRTFYQSEKYWATDDVNVLYPKFEMTENIALFLAPIIKVAGGMHEYDDKWKKEDMEKDTIKLPCKQDGEPDFEYMELFVKCRREKIVDSLNALKNKGIT